MSVRGGVSEGGVSDKGEKNRRKEFPIRRLVGLPSKLSRPYYELL